MSTSQQGQVKVWTTFFLLRFYSNTDMIKPVLQVLILISKKNVDTPTLQSRNSSTASYAVCLAPSPTSEEMEAVLHSSCLRFHHKGLLTSFLRRPMIFVLSWSGLL